MNYKLNLKKMKKKYRIWIIILFCLLGGAINAVGVKWFMKPANLIPLGSTGTAVAIESIIKKISNFDIPYFYVYFVLNMSLAFWAYFNLSKSLVVKSIVYIFGFTLASNFVPQIKITDQSYIQVIAGGTFNALSSLTVMFVGGTAAGYSFIGLYLSKIKNKPLVGVANTMGDFINMSIMLLFNGLEKVIMSLIASVVSQLIVDKLYNQSNYVSIHIVTKNPNLFVNYASSKLKRSSTLLKSKGSYNYEDNVTVVITISKFKFGMVKKELTQIDPSAYITIYNVNQVLGNVSSKVGVSGI